MYFSNNPRLEGINLNETSEQRSISITPMNYERRITEALSKDEGYSLESRGHINN